MKKPLSQKVVVATSCMYVNLHCCKLLSVQPIELGGHITTEKLPLMAQFQPQYISQVTWKQKGLCSMEPFGWWF